MNRNSTLSSGDQAKRNADYLRQHLAEQLGVDEKLLAKELSRQTGLPYQTIKNFVLGHDYSGRVFCAVFDILQDSPTPIKKSLAIDYIVKMLPETNRLEIMKIFKRSTWDPGK